MIKNPTFGSDFEMFLEDLTGRLFPACGIIGGTKDNPKPLPQKGYFVQEDNVLLEVNTPVHTDGVEFAKSLQYGVKYAAATLPPSLQVNGKSSHFFPEAYIRSIAQASVFGCEPDYNAWTQEQNPKPNCENKCFRTAAAHVHIGWDSPKAEDQLALVQWADVYVSVPSVLEAEDRTRRKLYGKAGAFRPKDYGIEHRVLDNYWIWNLNQAHEVFKRYMKAITVVNSGKKFPKEDVPLLMKAINEYNVDACKAIMRKYGSVELSF